MWARKRESECLPKAIVLLHHFVEGNASGLKLLLHRLRCIGGDLLVFGHLLVHPQLEHLDGGRLLKCQSSGSDTYTHG